MDDEDFKLGNWRKNEVGSSRSTGRCASTGSGADQLLKGDGTNWVGGRTNMYDNYVCGGGHCVGATEAEWKNIYKGCLGDATGPNTLSGRGANARNPNDIYKFSCPNMVTDANLSADPVSQGNKFNMGWMKLCASGNVYNEAVGAGTCSKDCDGSGAMHDVTGFFGLDGGDGGLMDPGCGGEYGTNYPSLGYWSDVGHTHAIPKNIQGISDLGGTWTSDKSTATSCPTTHSRGFQCAGDGYPAPTESGMPGCFEGKNITGLEGPLRFCARGPEHYEKDNLIKCCLGKKGDPSDPEHEECPVGYCRTSVKSSDIMASDTLCSDPTGDDLMCYEMTDECNDLFTSICTAELFNSEDTSKLGRQAQCRMWATIQPDKFNIFAKGICGIDERMGVTEETSLTDALQSTSNKKLLKNLFNSELCHEYLLTSREIQPQL